MSAFPNGPSPRVRGKRLPVCLPVPAGGSIPARAGETPAASTVQDATWVHPRACGGNFRVVSRMWACGGPSPRVRGKRAGPSRSPDMAGSIPARAGETSQPRKAPMRWGVHPRACGGNERIMAAQAKADGPSPRVRGKRGAPRVRDRRGRSIPARAGETRAEAFLLHEPGVHPRACGGNFAAMRLARPRTGPSPRVRGKRPRVPDLPPRRGSIPARAGETNGTARPGRRRRVHPRACGGKHRPIIRHPGPPGSIPARAGETHPRASWRVGSAVHPRACGGNLGEPVEEFMGTGPSPRVRGKPCERPLVALLLRSIPARAGETGSGSARHRAPSVHPRACGGNRSSGRHPGGAQGPSPRVRGKPGRLTARPAARGSIPARAGETRRSITRRMLNRVHPRACGGNSSKRL